MKFYSSIVSYLVEGKSTKQNMRMLIRFLVMLTAMITVYSIIFHFLMAWEEREYSWVTGFYWTLTVMSTLGFGDITFASDAGRLFSILVLLSGVIFMLVLLPFAFIKFFLAPWMESEAKRRAPREVSPDTKDHVIMTAYDDVTAALVERLVTYKRDYVVIVEKPEHAGLLSDRGVKAAVGNIDDPDTYKRMRVHDAALVVATNSDEVNTNIAFTVREMNESIPIITTADSPHSVDILSMAGSSRVVELPDLLARSFANWTMCGNFQANIIGRFDELVIAETPVINTPLVGKTIAESNLRESVGVTIVGIWERGRPSVPTPKTQITRSTVLLLAGTESQIASYDDVYSIYQMFQHAGDPVIIMGGGRVGTAIGRRFAERDVPFLIIEKNPKKTSESANIVYGDAADLSTLKRAWIEKAPAALITTHEDATNIYLTKYFRSLRPDLQIISRANLDRNVSTLHRAGADFVMSYPVLGVDAVFSFLTKQDVLMLVEGLTLFRVQAPEILDGVTLADSRIRQETHCSVVAIKSDGNFIVNPGPCIPVTKGSELILIGTYEGERQFFRTYIKT
ncbi:MAG TPA: NAD-binding protein [Syntrophorhabdus sp.]|nr:NAD-binding protein [Syntrophorhabdus sp.]MDI9559393.1 NAD-binding protein [Pseudomonadota bacterium]OPX97168.1 MAG: Trk system potassium uptake protein TrkA [Syntrophorhabdus sp. PtaB.Bin027]OQB75507.1 MAG: Trk system potassium uptake protein TrkA [Deltaproteobacteria bacterium ADurb.Bin135]MBP8745202.1 NAD-binding protein [Syntrophorhabdus sp.]